MDLSNVPYTIFADIISRVTPADAISCRRVSRRFHQALTRRELCISLILGHFPLSREAKKIRRRFQEKEKGSGCGERDEEGWDKEEEDYARVFGVMARRYFFLGRATPWKVRKVLVLKDEAKLRGVVPWRRRLAVDEEIGPPLDYGDPMWTLDPEAGLLVYPDANRRRNTRFVALDLETGAEYEVPFSMEAAIVRRVRLCHGVLIFEWADVNSVDWGYAADDEVYPHCVTVYRVRRARGDGDGEGVSSRARTWTWTFKFFCGAVLHHGDMSLTCGRFFSAHNATHYVVYCRGRKTEQDWDQSLFIYEFPTPFPSPTFTRNILVHDYQLRHFKVSHSIYPRLRNLAIDECTMDPRDGSTCGHVFFVEESHPWAWGADVPSDLPPLHTVQTTGIPLNLQGPVWLDSCDGREASTLGFCSRASSPVSSRGTLEWPGRAPCWRHDGFPRVTLSQVDTPSGVRFVARDDFYLSTLSDHTRPTIRIQGVTPTPSKITSSKPGTYDDDGGNHEPPSRGSTLRKDALMTGIGERFSEIIKYISEIKAKKDDEVFPYTESNEVQFADDMWDELMHRGFICGDERWIVGEDAKGDITILFF